MLRDYQQELVGLSASSQNILIQADTGAGKTRVLSRITENNPDVLLIAHRTILVRQISKTLAEFDIEHTVIATLHTRRQCELLHRNISKSGMLSEGKRKIVCSIDSLLSRYRRGRLTIDTSKRWLIIVDEAHHMVEDNKWGKLATIFSNSRIVGATATPCRLDGKSLARSHGGLFDCLVQARSLTENSTRTLIERGFLSDFVCYSMPEYVLKENLKKCRNGDYSYKSVNDETLRVKYQLLGDAVKHYKRLADGKQALVFAPSIELAKETAARFKQAGFAAAVIHSKQGSTEAGRVFDFFERKMIQVLVNVDMVGEGVDVPAIEVLIMLRKTSSFALYRQWIGRALRPAAGKEKAIILDHVGNILTHGLPDKPIQWSLESPPSSGKQNLIACRKCRALNLAWLDKCRVCGGDLAQSKDRRYSKQEMEYIDLKLVEMMRKKIDKAKRQQAAEYELANTIKMPDFNSGAMGVVKKKVATWFVEQLLSEGVSIYDTNTLLLSVRDSDQFWVNNFTFSDINNNHSKCIKVYRKWLQSK